MKLLVLRIWSEPAVFIGLLTTVALILVNVIGEDDWGLENVIAILAPLVSSLGIRQLVTPVAGKLEVAEPDATTFDPKVPK